MDLLQHPHLSPLEAARHAQHHRIIIKVAKSLRFSIQLFAAAAAPVVAVAAVVVQYARA